MAFWGVLIKPGKPFTLLPYKTSGRLRISQATLGAGSSNNRSSSVQCNVGRTTPVLLCSLLPNKAESIHLELEFNETEEVTFSVVGPRSVYLTGYVIGKSRQLLFGPDESESYGEDVGDADTELSDDVGDEDEYGGSFIDDTEPTFSPSSPSCSEEGFFCIAANKGKKKPSKGKRIHKRLKKTCELSESEDDGVTSLKNHGHNLVQIMESDEDDQKVISLLCGNVKVDREAVKRTVDDVAEQTTSDGKVTNKVEDVTGLAPDDCQYVNKKLKRKVDDVSLKEIDDCQCDDREVKRRRKADNAAEKSTDDCQSDDRKEKRKKRKSKTDGSPPEDTENGSNVTKGEADALVENGGKTTDVSGLVIEEIETGEQDGKIASSGRKISHNVTVHYTGTLKEQGRVFCSTVGKKPLKFRLGKDTVLVGLHLGIDGMRVGGKRRLLIPPELGYGSEGSDGVPPNAWLVMDVELLRVR
ncbi:peptidyl-prolyl cis-trans isomerase FKBP43-like [Silene latifolia]|uniref:peptidyl-prolyl cis-trans isomerase FKBP43-like n=1 Tax=Silene latifolia TaxID=37657 RepID=UPI003D77C103